ncbi:dynamin family protein [Paenibacillus larvae]|uniref:Dynamin family protein n=3 Tax=Paenibacillus larvae TaxID=1464 RepID=A0AAP5JS70_9BACL|nr:dynamin family protein [Paenibacillus larvae]AVF23306.1 dynamin family protein [Paenibacillus larvae subsp. larvae]MCY9561788.1 dynamin family protein [Paenibacillus larvae]MCY9566379.1 dynamin family protein [Paenibacillus larvae]MCY9570422.1 dynamin family protein [Paenibacillus larvae]MCY9689245.1 dynamin family protein [Paenibacillus larvae]
MKKQTTNRDHLHKKAIQLQRTANIVKEAGDNTRADQLLELKGKLENKQLTLSFCGHFSAGKSTMINHLCGTALLPSSPIPTSANVVSITNGEKGAEVIHRTEQGLVKQEKSLEQVQQYCLNGRDIETVRLRYLLPFLGRHTILLDTPGIDSTDDAHHRATESALHLADVVFYVMDYNHVQSEVNLTFAKQMQERGKPLYLIVNQIDKHREEELTFERFKESAYEAFRNWEINPGGWLFLSLKEPAHPNNEWTTFTALIQHLIDKREELLAYNIDQAATYVLSEHVKWTGEQQEERKVQLKEKLNGESCLQARKELEELQERLCQADAEAVELEKKLKQELQSIIDHAQITPPGTRELAARLMESIRPSFKVGWLNRAQQTAAERQRRLLAFDEDYRVQVESQLEWHVQDAVKKAIREQQVSSDREDLLKETETLQADITPEWLQSRIQADSALDNAYTLNYMKKTAGEIRQIIRTKTWGLLERIAQRARDRAASLREQSRARLSELQEQLAAEEELRHMAQRERAYEQSLRGLLEPLEAVMPRLPDLARLTTEAGKPAYGVVNATPVMDAILRVSHGESANCAAPADEERVAAAQSRGTQRSRVERTAARLRQAEALIREVPAMRTIARSLRDKAERLADRTFTVALFGAFSAGKSSFTNALLGERVLPVSPNPTTAAINTIMAPNEAWPHGTAKIKMKSRETLTADVLHSLDVLGIHSTTLEEALLQIKELDSSHIVGKGKPHVTFLKAVDKGWEETSDHLGEEIRADIEGFSSYVAQEHKSCFVEEIGLHYASLLLEDGVRIVDTPGADSINARHTGVAFNYIKNADAVWFVTYYNHAFSQADREFLLQLGRVKDSFELDKMFFVVNATDLASSKKELQEVLKHVAFNLQQHGIRQPKLYPVSSHKAIEAKQGGNIEALHVSGMDVFEGDFNKFTFEELTDISIRAANQELERAVHVLSTWIDNAREDEAERINRASLLRKTETAVLSILDQVTIETELKELTKEIRELLYYVKQRNSYRFNELYNLAFNPSSFRESGNRLKEVLLQVWQELFESIQFDLQQEVLATTLRVENTLNRLAQRKYVELGDRVKERLDDFEYETYESLSCPPWEGHVSLIVEGVSDKMLVQPFKNSKSFFEGEGKAKLRDQLERLLEKSVENWVREQTVLMIDIYQSFAKDCLEELRNKQKVAVKEHVEGILEALEMKFPLDRIVHMNQQLEQLVKV